MQNRKEVTSLSFEREMECLLQRARRLPFGAVKLLRGCLRACWAGSAHAVAVGWGTRCPSLPLKCHQTVGLRSLAACSLKYL